MLRMPAFALIAVLAATSVAQSAVMKPTAPQKMASPADKAKMKACEAKAAAQKVPANGRAKFLMDCMKAN
jgi:hypothetical protein